MPRFSVVLPTFNRADTLPRAVSSVLAQTMGDLELIVVDDGSTDGTADGLSTLDPRVNLIRQENRGVSSARNAGLRSSSGELIAFIDSDDEWLPRHLEVAAAFFDALPQEDILQTEILIRFDGGQESVFPREEIAYWYPRLARRIGSHLLDLPAGERDDYMRVFSERRTAVWLPATLLADGSMRRCRHYRGAVYDHLRWGYLTSVLGLVITRRASITAGVFNQRLSSAEDFAYMATLLRAFPLNFLSIPDCIKHEEAAQEHLALGSHAAEFRENLYGQFDHVLSSVSADPAERRLLLGYKAFDVVEAALKEGDRKRSERYLRMACGSIPRFWRGRIVSLLLRATRSARFTYHIYRILTWVEHIVRPTVSGNSDAPGA